MGLEKKTSKANDVSIIICTKDRHDLLLKSVAHLQSTISEKEYLEIVVIEETDKPQPLNTSKIRYNAIPQRGRGLGFTRNKGLAKARGSIIVFIDDDVLPAQNWLENLLEPFRDESVGAVGGAVLPDLLEINTIGKCASFLGFPAGGLKRYLRSRGENHESELISTGNCAFRAELGRSAGGFDELLRNGEDTEFFSRIARISKTIFVPKAIVFHKQRDSLMGVLRWFIKRGRGRFLRACKKGAHPLYATASPLRGNFLLKLFTFLLVSFILSFFSYLAFIAFILSAYLVWNTILWKRGHNLYRRSAERFDEQITRIQNAIKTPDVVVLLPLVKLFMDIGREIGKLTALCGYIKHRVFEKPLVLTFHHIATQGFGRISLSPKYSCSKALFEKILKDSERDGWVIISLSELLKRLKENRRTLYFEKLLTVTFDDGYASIYEPLTELSDASQGPYPFTIFVPTALVGTVSQWKGTRTEAFKEILTWKQLEKLKANGIEFGSHTCNHTDLREAQAPLRRREIAQSLEDLRDHFSNQRGKDFALSYPYGSYDQDVVQIVKQTGYVGAVANYKGNIRPKTDPYQIPRFTVFADSDWRTIAHQSHSMWAKDLIRDIRDWMFRPRL